MLLGLLVVVLFLCFFIKDYRKGIILAAMTIQFLAYLGTGIPGVKISTLLMLISIAIYLFKKTIKQINPRIVSFQGEADYPKSLIIVSLLFITSFLISDYNAENRQTAIVITNILTMFFFPYVFWKSISSMEYLRYAIKCLIVLFTISFIIAIPELLFRHNYYIDVIGNLFLLEDFVIDAHTVRFGIKRLNSIFSYLSVLGTISCFAFFLFFNLKYRYTYLYDKYKVSINCLCLILPFMAFATGSRAIFLGLFAIFLSCVCDRCFFKHKSFKKLLLIFIVVSPIVLYIVAMVIDSIINSDTSKYAQGSTSDLRMLQWAICLPYFLESPLWGNGRMFIWDVVAKENPMLLGAESIWFSILVDYGIFGGIAFLSLLLVTGRLLFKVKKAFVFFPVSYFLITLVSPDSGIQYNVYLTFVILLLKSNYFAKEDKVTLIKKSKYS